MNVIEVSHVSKRYIIGQKASYNTLRDTIAGFFSRSSKNQDFSEDYFWALKDISFTVKAGESLAFIGNNGAGKSTLLKILARVTFPTSGSVRLRGRMASLLEVGTGFHPELSGRENIFLSGSILGMSHREIKAKFDEIVDFAEVEKFLDTPVKYYSSGMYVRLAFSVAAHLEPEILIVDEVLAVGDIRFQKKCLGKMNASALSGRTILFVSHNVAAIRSLCSRAILLNHGMIEMEGPVNDVTGYYLQQHCTSTSVQTWESGHGPGNYACKFLKVRVADEEGNDLSVADISKDIYIELSYEVIEEGSQVSFSFSLLSGEGVCAFSSFSNQEPKYYGTPLKRGVYVTRCRVPGHTLNNGKFNVTINGFAAIWSDSFCLEQIVSFEAHDDGILKGDFHGGFRGLLRPKLLWTTEKIYT
jgi:lipopolysaccharide transport system ATP-binding protein